MQAQSWNISSAVLLTVLLAVSTAFAQSTPPPGDLGQDRQDLRRDQRDIQQDRRDLREDRRDIGQDRRDIRTDRTDIRQDRQGLQQDRNDIRADRRGTPLLLVRVPGGPAHQRFSIVF